MGAPPAPDNLEARGGGWRGEAFTVKLVILAFLLGWGLARWGTPVARQAALRFGIVDRPDGQLKRQTEPVPYLGGLAVYLAFLIALALVFEFDRRVLGLLLSGTLVLLLGLIDDLGVLSPAVKLAGQLVACWVLIKSDVMIHVVWLPPWAQVALTILWLLTAANALNLMDIMDGLAPGVALTACVALVVATAANGDHVIPVMAAALAGSLLGFLPYNWRPARIYLGDSGSLFLGLMLGALSMTGKYTAYNRVGFVAPLLILGLPLFDTAFVSVVRIAKGSSPFRGSPDHFPLRLLRMGLSVPAVVALACSATAALGALALVNVRLLAPGGTVILLVGASVVAVGFAAVLLVLEARTRRLAGPRLEKGIRSRQSDRIPADSRPGRAVDGE
jgi:UDP-GlcNAc:undecaprenyl-phosphate GlcNAc-1-phosphate transferase